VRDRPMFVNQPVDTSLQSAVVVLTQTKQLMGRIAEAQRIL